MATFRRWRKYSNCCCDVVLLSCSAAFSSPLQAGGRAPDAAAVLLLRPGWGGKQARRLRSPQCSSPAQQQQQQPLPPALLLARWRGSSRPVQAKGAASSPQLSLKGSPSVSQTPLNFHPLSLELKLSPLIFRFPGCHQGRRLGIPAAGPGNGRRRLNPKPVFIVTI